MVQCVALRDGLIRQTTYIRAGETFLAEKCPTWAEAVKPKKSVTTKDADNQESQKGK
jgi:hypothetical protein